MINRVRARRQARLLGIAVGVLLGLAAPLRAGDATVFIAEGSPREPWSRGYGGTLSTSWFSVVNLEGEVARLPGAAPDSSMTSFTAGALLAPPIGIATPYGGLGVGLFRQSLGTRRDTGTLKALVLGLKVKIGLLVVKGEYRRYDLSGAPLLPLDSRLSLGAGIAF
jgi:hypothetical protein